jgi:hypothetical protein
VSQISGPDAVRREELLRRFSYGGAPSSLWRLRFAAKRLAWVSVVTATRVVKRIIDGSSVCLRQTARSRRCPDCENLPANLNISHSAHGPLPVIARSAATGQSI